MKSIISFLIVILIGTNCLSQSFSSLAIFISEDETGKPIASASIIVKEAGWASKTSGIDGKAFFDKSMPVGEIHYIVSKEGYQGIEGTFNITTEEKSNSLNIKLSKFRDDRLLITGEVVDEEERDLEGAIVEVKVADIVKTAKTDASGNYKIELTLNRTQYDVNILKLEVKCSNGSGKKTEMIDLTRRNVIYKDFKVNCKERIEEGKGTPMQKFEKGNLLFELKNCTQIGTNIKCVVRITAKEKDTLFGVYKDKGHNYGITRFFDEMGAEYYLTDSKIANIINDYNGDVSKNLIADFPVDMVLTFGGVEKEVSTISKLEIFSFRDWGGTTSNWFTIPFRKISIKD